MTSKLALVSLVLKSSKPLAPHSNGHTIGIEKAVVHAKRGALDWHQRFVCHKIVYKAAPGICFRSSNNIYKWQQYRSSNNKA